MEGFLEGCCSRKWVPSSGSSMGSGRTSQRRGLGRYQVLGPASPLSLQGKKFVGDLQPDGRIVWQETGQVFNSPSAWATHCKKLVNPAKKSGCGWASVKYKGQKLDKYKAAWLRRHQLHVPAAAADESPASEGEEEELLMEEEEEEVLAGASAEDKSRRPPAKGTSEPAHPEATPPGKRMENKIRVPVRYCMLGSRDSARNPHTLVEVTSFAAINKFQPFNVAISSNVLFLLDFHSHLTRSEVVGYLGGRWDINSQSGYLGPGGQGGVWGRVGCPYLLPASVQCSLCCEPSRVAAGWETRILPPWKRR